MHTIISRSLLVAAVLVLSSRSAWAYLDPGMGSLLLQGLLATLAAGAAAVSLFWHRITSFFRRRPRPPAPPSERPNKQ